MPDLSVRRLNRRVYEKLRVRAAKHGVSMEEEVRRIIEQVVTAPENLSNVFLKYFGSENGIDLDILNQRHLINPFEAIP